jgi:hypothetical protein
MGRQTWGIMILAGMFVLFFCVCSFWGCKTVNRNVVYSGTPIFDRYDTLHSVVLSTDLELNYPKQMFI